MVLATTKIILKLTTITMIPTSIIMVFTGSRRESEAAMGAATMPPKISPKITCQCENPMSEIKASELANDTKNSVRFTEPIV